MDGDITSASSPDAWQVLSDARTTNAMILGALTLVAYDHLLTLSKEIELMWPSRTSFPLTNMIYLWNRYFTLISLSYDASVMLSPYKSNAVCIKFFQGEAVTSTIILATVDLILMLRVWLLYEKKRLLLYLLVPMIGLEILTMAVVSHYTIASVPEYWPVNSITGCFPMGNVPRFFAFYSVPVLVVSVTMFVLTVYKCGTSLLAHGRVHMPIHALFLRDGVFWFIIIFVTFIPEIAIWARGRQSLAELLIAPGLAISSIVGSRVLLNIKSLGHSYPRLPESTTARNAVEFDTIDYALSAPWRTTLGHPTMSAITEVTSEERGP
ncbi:hypothetical protein MIND_00632900 [Mycena indigotica]|uniref:DUF6533 domain-containing protein n=1 Tax=Mycena indigotica TaxID=2126181 RepID=A0A8H6STD4_9AGAR|nr:uncharacterized protein MIND_00632900 [Mycena indigotica]KAF7304017.1 hypothetical protein MIND_00632900 [Mycena indigotica]